MDTLGLRMPCALSMRRLSLSAAVVLLASLQACRTSAPSAPGAAASSTSEPPAATAKPTLPPDAPLAGEARWLTELFAGTPVQVAGEPDGSVVLRVPMKYAFDAAPASTTPAAVAPGPKPPLQAVLDKLSQSLKRQPAAKLQAAAPAGPRSAERLAAVRSHLATKGVPNWRIASASPPADDQMLFRLVAPPAGLRKLDDGTLAPTSAGRVLPPPNGGSGAAH
ncbi:MAG TPA: hypothetical protein VFY73_29345 [Ideonella sp.]|uniref:hypothetical protein n=1 Tax=Ideonella sp. TaxID=1929293 RepID=UPI002E36BF5C|nr:hypothetical protein [Ideonella sp.]HEX5688144.1 hypothetical protein [Ideonella sp.]